MITLFKRAALAAVFATVFAVSSAAQQGTERREFGGDVFSAGSDVRIGGAAAEDVFAAGETVTLESEVRESAHLAGRNVRLASAVGRDLYAAGYAVDIAGAIGGDVIAAGYRVEIAPGASVGEDVLAAGRNVFVRGAVAGDAMLAGENVEIAAAVSGAVQIRASHIVFGPGARIDGRLEYWSENDVAISGGVIAADRVTAHRVAPNRTASMPVVGFLIGGLIFLAFMIGLIAIFAFVLPKPLARAREALAAGPWRTLLLGVAGTSALFGSILVLAVSLIGIPLLPLIAILTPFALFAGYVTAAHAAGALLVARARRAETTSGLVAFGAVLVGLVMLALIGLVPLLGWVVAVLATCVGLGSWIALWLGPRPMGPALAGA